MHISVIPVINAILSNEKSDKETAEHKKYDIDERESRVVVK